MLFRILLGAGFAALFTAMFVAGSTTELAREDAEFIQDAVMPDVEEVDTAAIFFNNMLLTLIMFLPGFGAGFTIFAAWFTGVVYSSMVAIAPVAGSIHPLELLYLTPFGLMEVAAYSIASSRSLLLGVKVVKRRPLAEGGKIVLMEVAVVAGLVLAGAAVEEQILSVIDDPGWMSEGASCHHVPWTGITVGVDCPGL